MTATNSTGLAATLERLEAGYRQANPTSERMFERAKGVMPGGNTRAVLYYDPFPLTFVRGEGATVTDADGHSYANYVGEYGAGLFGHSDPRLKHAAIAAIEDGVMLGGLNGYEAPFAELIRTRFPSMERLRFVNSGTEANLFAITTARMATRRSDIVVFDFGYHGGLLTYPNGVQPHDVPFPTRVAPYNDVAGTEAILAQAPETIACVVIEPMMGSGGGCVADPAFMQWLRRRTAELGIVLILDEVVTSRMSGGGMQQRLGIRPDMTTIGKYFGGGFAFGAFGGREDIMAVWDLTRGGVGHAGTFNNNPVSLAAGLTGLRDVFTPDVADALFERGERLAQSIVETGRRHGLPLHCLGAGSVRTLQLQHAPIRGPRDLRTPLPVKKILHLALLERGQSLGRRGYITLSLPQSEEDDRRFVAALDDVLAAHHAALLEGIAGTA
jgi:glutamate-1-semialdehyde 2,1-aminomutase